MNVDRLQQWFWIDFFFASLARRKISIFAYTSRQQIAFCAEKEWFSNCWGNGSNQSQLIIRSNFVKNQNTFHALGLDCKFSSFCSFLSFTLFEVSDTQLVALQCVVFAYGQTARRLHVWNSRIVFLRWIEFTEKCIDAERACEEWNALSIDIKTNGQNWINGHLMKTNVISIFHWTFLASTEWTTKNRFVAGKSGLSRVTLKLNECEDQFDFV